MSNSRSPEASREHGGNPHAIDIRGLDKALILAALYNGATPINAGFFQYDPVPMSLEDAKKQLESSTFFDYLKGRAMKVRLDGDELDSERYDSRNGEGAARTIIESLKADEKPDPNNPTIRNRHLAEARRQAQITRELLHESPTIVRRGTRTADFQVGLDDIADELDPVVEEAQRRIRELQKEE